MSSSSSVLNASHLAAMGTNELPQTIVLGPIYMYVKSIAPLSVGSSDDYVFIILIYVVYQLYLAYILGFITGS